VADVVDQWQLDSWDAYREVPRLGRKKGLREEQRTELWAIFERVDAELNARGLLTMSRVFAAATRALQEGQVAPFDFAIIDEAQDVSVPQLRFLAAAAAAIPMASSSLATSGSDLPDALLVEGAWGRRSRPLEDAPRQLQDLNEIRRCADRLLPPQLSDVDGNPSRAAAPSRSSPGRRRSLPC